MTYFTSWNVGGDLVPDLVHVYDRLGWKRESLLVASGPRDRSRKGEGFIAPRNRRVHSWLT